MTDPQVEKKHQTNQSTKHNSFLPPPHINFQQYQEKRFVFFKYKIVNVFQ